MVPGVAPGRPVGSRRSAVSDARCRTRGTLGQDRAPCACLVDVAATLELSEPTIASTARRSTGFWLLAATLVAFLAASSAPSPLYVVYQARWHFSALVLTLVFAVYVVALLLALLVAGGLSDFLGRRRVIAAALVVEVLAMAAFVVAGGVGGLLMARAVQGLATGVATGALSAAITDLAPPERPALAAAVNTAAPSVGLALGAVASGLLVEHGPAPRSLVFALLGGIFVLLLAGLAAVPESVPSRPGALASLRPAAAVPRQARTAFRIALPVLVATWAVGGLVLSLGPSLAVGVLGLRSHLTGGLVVAAVVGVSAVSSVQSRRALPRTAMVQGALVLSVGVAIVLAGLGAVSGPVFFAGLVVTGWGFGAAFVGAFGSVASLATPTQRAELFAAVYVASYVAFGVCAVLAGLAVPHVGLRPVAVGYGLAVIALSLTAAVAGRRPAPVGSAAAPTVR